MFRKLSLVFVVGLALFGATTVLADGTETLGPPSVSVASGTTLTVAGVGTEATHSGTISFNVTGTPKQALLYWSGHFTAPNTGDDTIALEGSNTSTAGKTAAGPSASCPAPDYKYANKLTLGSAGFVTSLNAVMSGSGAAGSQSFRMMIYSDSSGSPGQLLAQSSAVSVAGTAAAATVSFPLADAVYLAAGTYWIAQQSGPISGGSGQGCVSADHTAGTNLFNPDSFSDGPSASYGAATTETNEWSFSATLNSATAVTGTSIGGPSCFFALGGTNPCDPAGPSSNVFQTYRADITGLGLVTSGSNTLTVGGLDFHANDGGSGNAGATGPNWPDGNDGAGVVVISDDGSGASSVAGLFDGQDLAFFRFPSPYTSTVPKTFSFTASTTARQATLSTLASSVAGPASGFGSVRPNQLKLTFDVGGTTTIQNPWGSASGPEFDALNTTITVPAGASSLTVQALSATDPANPSQTPASLNWLVGALTLPKATQPSAGTFTQGFWKNHPNAWPVQSVTLGSSSYTKAQGITLLQTPPAGGNATLILVHQLIAAELNVAGGADSSCITSTINAANTLLAANGGATGTIRSSSTVGVTATTLANTLDQYNNGNLCAHSGE